MAKKQGYIELKNLEVYKLARELSQMGWKIYEKLGWEDKRLMGDQFIKSTDSIGSNIAEGYARYHYLDKIKFYYISRASLSEACNHWLELLYERKKLSKEDFEIIKSVEENLSIKLNNFIDSTYRSINSGNKFL